MNCVQDSINKIILNRSDGASELAVKTLHAIRQMVISNEATDVKHFMRDLTDLIDILSKCRPSIATIYNCAHRFYRLLQICSQKFNRLEDLRHCCLENLIQLEDEIALNKSKSIINAANSIINGSTLATCSYSSTIIEVIHNTLLQGKKISLRILQSQSGTISYGQLTLKQLETKDLNCQLISDDLLPGSLDGINLILLGADAVYSDGSVLNGYPSLKLAKAAAAHTPSIPVFVVCDSLKFCLDHHLEITESDFDVIPRNLLSGLITEDGIAVWEEM